jgi:hypothetical protein
MNEYGALMNNTDTGKPKYLEKNPSQCHSVHHKSTTDGAGITTSPMGETTLLWLQQNNDQGQPTTAGC